MIIMERVSQVYPGNHIGVQDISLHIHKGEFVFVVGKSGSGKTTLMKLLMKELDSTSGRIFINKKLLNNATRRTLPYIRRNIGVIFQDFRLLGDRSVYENVAFAQKVIEAPQKEIRKNVLRTLSMVGLLDKYNNNPNELSGGEQQRVAIARALVNKPEILVCDEPTGNLDVVTAEEIMKLIEMANKQGTTVLVVTHNLDIVQEMNKRTITMSNGRIVSDMGRGGYFYED